MGSSLPAVRGGGQLARPLATLARQANREHEKATSAASDAIDHAVKAGELLAKARDMADAGEWSNFVTDHFDGSLRTAQKYMRLARHWRKLLAQPPGVVSSQAEAAKALTSIMQGDRPPPSRAKSNGTRRARGASVEKGGSLVRAAAALLRRVERDLNAIEPVTYQVRNAIRVVNTGRSELEAFIRKTFDDVEGSPLTEAESSPATPPEAHQGGYDAVS